MVKYAMLFDSPQRGFIVLIFRLEVANKKFLFTKPEFRVHKLYMNLFTVHELKLPDKKI